MPEEPRGYIFTGNAAQGGTYTGPNYGDAAPFSSPLPQLSFAQTNPTFLRQQFYAPPPPPPPVQDMPVMRQPVPTQPVPRITPPSTGDAGLDSPRRTDGPHGRTMQEIAGTPYLSAEEKTWFESQYRPTQPQPQAPRGNAYSSPVSAPPASGLQEYATNTAQQAGINPTFFSNLISHESGWKPDAINPISGAAGLGQFLPSTAAAYGVTPDQLRSNPQLSLDLAATMLGELLGTFRGNQQQAFAAYFIGPGNVMEAIRQGGPGGWLAAADAIARQYGQGTVSQYLRSIGAL